MSEISEALEAHSQWSITEWLRSLGVLCDCSDGIRDRHGPIEDSEPCDRCVLVEVGGIRVRAKHWMPIEPQQAGLMIQLPAVEVTDE